MNATVTKLSSNKVKIDFAVEPEVFERGMQSAYRKVVGRINIPGFRKGKTPRKVIELQYGESIFYEDAVDAIFPEVYGEAVKQHGLNPVDRPEFDLKSIGSGKILEFSVEVFVKPDVKLGKYLGVTAERHEAEVTEDDVKAEIERARDRAATFVDVSDRPVKLDDEVTIDYKGFCDGEQFEGGTAEDHKLLIGSGSFIPGFEEQLVGAEVGKETIVNVTFPEEYHAENLKGKSATFHVTVKAIQEKDVPELDDEFAKDVSECETLEEYRAKVRDDLQKKADERGDADFEHHVVEAVVETTEIDVPERMVEDRIDSMVRDMEMRLMYQGMNLQTYLGYVGQTEQQMRDYMRDNADRDVRTQLTLEAVSEAEQVTPTDEEVDAEIAQYVERSRGDLEKFKQNMADDDREYFAKIVKMQKTVDLLKANAVVGEHSEETSEETSDATE